MKAPFIKFLAFILLIAFVFTPNTAFAAKQIIRGEDGAFYVIDTDDPKDVSFSKEVGADPSINPENSETPIPKNSQGETFYNQNNNQTSNNQHYQGNVSSQDAEDAADYEEYQDSVKKNKVKSVVIATIGVVVVVGLAVWAIIAGSNSNDDDDDD